MTSVTKERIISGLIGSVASLAVALIIFGFQRKAYLKDLTESELKKKAPYEYVDSRDNEIKHDLGNFKVDQDARHERESEQTNEKLDLIIKLIEAKSKR